MEYNNFKDNDLKASVLGFGGWQLGNKEFWDGPSYQESIDLVKEAYNKGINFFDTAPGYSSGLSEKVIGEALKNVRNKILINSKFGHTADGQMDFSVSSIETRLRESLERLQTNYIDSFILHNPETYILEGKTDHFKEMQRLKEMGLLKAYGVSIDSLHELRLVLDNLEVDVIEVMFNIIHQEPKEVFDEITQKGISIITKIPFDSGWLTGKYDSDSVFTGIRSRWNKEEINTRSKITEKIKEITKNEDLVPVALSFIRSFKAVTTIIPGIKNLNQLESNIKSIEYVLSDETKKEITDLYDAFIVNEHTPW